MNERILRIVIFVEVEGIEQYLSVDGQPYVMIPVDMDVAKKLGWPIHMLPSMPKWLSKIIE
jgi:hypothetical protein